MKHVYKSLIFLIFLICLNCNVFAYTTATYENPNDSNYSSYKTRYISTNVNIEQRQNNQWFGRTGFQSPSSTAANQYKRNRYTLTVARGNYCGSTSGGGTYKYGQRVSYSGSRSGGLPTQTDWSGETDAVRGNTRYAYSYNYNGPYYSNGISTMPASNHTVTAYFNRSTGSQVKQVYQIVTIPALRSVELRLYNSSGSETSREYLSSSYVSQLNRSESSGRTGLWWRSSNSGADIEDMFDNRIAYWLNNNTGCYILTGTDGRTICNYYGNVPQSVLNSCTTAIRQGDYQGYSVSCFFFPWNTNGWNSPGASSATQSQIRLTTSNIDTVQVSSPNGKSSINTNGYVTVYEGYYMYVTAPSSIKWRDISRGRDIGTGKTLRIYIPGGVNGASIRIINGSIYTSGRMYQASFAVV